ncbi:hypothetical protein HETIRDRAFT_447256 [Heterobasidion irregulare TC 32-1]|uniref:Uncharacterized protein n=1 Tax=Heterobasidion irregulare (strain TC 32-1) TaxID=747525 RepID=W4KL36_HETIT|nr:uncharacterized protein HETIRDRAFT_447256 [Heterobasidion irregulare TC 32-1]ETW86537.1 hypothetical protein HETIRDRAFT_447256 [Heterobasidion irregulare TC 32-1]
MAAEAWPAPVASIAGQTGMLCETPTAAETRPAPVAEVAGRLKGQLAPLAKFVMVLASLAVALYLGTSFSPIAWRRRNHA